MVKFKKYFLGLKNYIYKWMKWNKTEEAEKIQKRNETKRNEKTITRSRNETKRNEIFKKQNETK
jgi:hypothetical protein